MKQQELSKPPHYSNMVEDIAPFPLVKIFTVGEEMFFNWQSKTDYSWRLITENGDIYAADVVSGEMLVLPMKLPEGYHQLTLNQLGNKRECLVIVAPMRCYEPEAILQQQKLWGVNIQLYSLRSERNWGIGDFTDLNRLIKKLSKNGADFIGINPIHSLYLADPNNASPYNASSRRWLNSLYIDVTALPDFQQSELVQKWWKKEGIQKKVAQLRKVDWVDYVGVATLKMEALTLSYQNFCARKADDPLQRSFTEFVTKEGEELYQHALFQTIHAELKAQDRDADINSEGWPVWPTEFQHPLKSGAKAFAKQYHSQIMFYSWLQWVTKEQLANTQRYSEELGMKIGLYRDLALGDSRGGSYTWANPELYAFDYSIGAPPDLLAPKGQNWSIPPMYPKMLEEDRYQSVITILRENMQHCGALRLDHVMGLYRLWWIDEKDPSGVDEYISYPFNDLLAIVKLESQRNKCLIIGEDLGTVPKEMLSPLAKAGVYSYKVLYFAHDSEFRFPSSTKMPTQSFSTVSTHDLPTFRGFWQGYDMQLRDQLQLYPSLQRRDQILDERYRIKQGILNALHLHQLLPKYFERDASQLGVNPTLHQGIQGYLAMGESAILGIQLEDLLDMTTPVNLPGTNKEYPNWRRKINATLEEIFADRDLDEWLLQINKTRKLASERY